MSEKLVQTVGEEKRFPPPLSYAGDTQQLQTGLGACRDVEGIPFKEGTVSSLVEESRESMFQVGMNVEGQESRKIPVARVKYVVGGSENGIGEGGLGRL